MKKNIQTINLNSVEVEIQLVDEVELDEMTGFVEKKDNQR